MKLKKGKNIIENIIWSITELYKFQKKYIGLFWFQAVISGILPIVSLVLIQQIINILQYKTAGIELLIIKLVIMILFRLFCGISLNYLKLAIENLELEFGAYLQAKILKKIAMLDSKDFENSKTYDLINRTRYDGNAGILGTIKILFAFISVLISTISYIAIIANYNIFIFSVIIVLPVIRYFYERKYNLEEYNVSIRNTEMERKSSYISFLLTNSENFKEIKLGSIIFLMGLASNVLGYRHPAAILDRSKNKCCGLITDGEELKNNQLCFSVDTTVLHLFSDLSRTCPRTSGGWIPPLALTPKNNRSVSFLVA